MRLNDTGEVPPLAAGFIRIIYVEQNDTIESIVPLLRSSAKPIALVLPDHASVFLRPLDLVGLKRARRFLSVPIVIIALSESHFTRWARQAAFPVYPSLALFARALYAGEGPSPSTHLSHLQPLVPSLSTPRSPDRAVSSEKGLRAVGESGGFQPVSTGGGGRTSTSFPRLSPPGTGPSLYRKGQSPSPAPQRRRQRRRFSLLPIVPALLCILLLGGILGYAVLAPHVRTSPSAPAPADQSVGSAAFISSGQFNQSSSQGINDEVSLDLQGIPDPARGQSYYAWLLSDANRSDTQALLLGRVLTSHGRAQFLYPGDGQHTDLLAGNSRILVTEESATVLPALPSPDKTAWRYFAEIPQQPNPADTQNHYSLLDHLRHLLAADPKLEARGLSGGLGIWLYRNTSSVLAWAQNARDDWGGPDPGQIHRQVVRILDYLDGSAFVGQDVPAGTPLLVDPQVAQVALLELDPQKQDPPGYLYHISFHLAGLIQSPGATAELRSQVAQLETGVNNITRWLEQVRQDAVRLVGLSNPQLWQQSTLPLLNDLLSQANAAYVGVTGSSSSTTQQGVSWLYNRMQMLSTMDLAPLTTQVTRGLTLAINPSSQHTPPVNGECSLIVPPNPLTAQGLATPFVLQATDPQAGPCREATPSQAAFVQAAIFDPATGQIGVYNPLVVDQGSHPALPPVVPRFSDGAIVGIWFGSNGTTLHLVDAQGSLQQGHCVNGIPGSPFGQFSYCNAPAFFQAALLARSEGVLNPPPLGIAKDGLPCPTVRDFAVVDQDQSDNVTTSYLVTADGRTAQNTRANITALPQAQLQVNGSDNRLLAIALDGALGCTPWEAPDLADPGQMVTALPLDELQAAAEQAAPIALVPATDPMVLVNNAPNLDKLNAYRAGVDQPQAQTLNDGSSVQYCQHLVDIAPSRLLLDSTWTKARPSLDPALASSLFTFLAQRFATTYGKNGLDCLDLLNQTAPVTVKMNAQGVAIAAIINGQTVSS